MPNPRLVDNGKRRRRRRRRRPWWLPASAAVVLIFLVVALAAILRGARAPKPGPVSSEAAVSLPSATSARTTDRSVIPTKPVSESTPVSSAVSVSSTTAADTFFDDAVFIGDSRTEGLKLYTNLIKPTFLSHIGLNVLSAQDRSQKVVMMDDGQKVSVLEGLEKKKYGKIYVMLGINELGWPYVETFIQEYGKFIDKIKAAQPDANIYVQSVLPISRKISDSDTQANKNLSKQRIDLFNKAIEKMCEEKGVHYVPVEKAVQDADGFLPEEATTDGIHLNKTYCMKWQDYLRNNTR